jgi:AcrR family transcriptional regulator
MIASMKALFRASCQDVDAMVEMEVHVQEEITQGRRYGGMTGERRREERRTRLVDAGLELFAKEGYARTPIERICEVARVTTRHFYELFPNKEALLVAVLDGVIDHARAAVFRALAMDTQDPRERVRPGISAFVHSYLDDPRHVRIALFEVVGVSRELERHRRDISREFARIIEGQIAILVQQGVIPERDYGLFAMALGGAQNDLLIDWENSDDPYPVERIIDEIVLLYDAAFRGLEMVKKEDMGKGRDRLSD